MRPRFTGKRDSSPAPNTHAHTHTQRQAGRHTHTPEDRVHSFIYCIGSELFVIIPAAHGSPQGAQGFDQGIESSSRRNRPRQARRRWESNAARRRWDSRAATTSVRELPLSGMREELSVREEPHPRVMSADQQLYNKAGRSQACEGPSGKASSEGRAREAGGSLRVGRGGSVTGSQAHLPKARRCGRASGLLCARRAELWIVTRRRWKRPSRVIAWLGPNPGREEFRRVARGRRAGGSSQPEGQA